MSFRSHTGLALTISLLMLSTPVATADVKPTPSPTSKSSFANLREQYEIAIQDFRLQVKLREQERRQIRQIFILAVMGANKTAKMALRMSTTPEAKTVIIATQKKAVALAVTVRDSAIQEMGPEPIKPIKPIKPEALKAKVKTKSSKPSPSP
ncbi:MAG: hypothetical protein O3A27_02965 [Actinomycetota bacterium]|nr:hypothetical protein [Actinomycetota bacterium]